MSSTFHGLEVARRALSTQQSALYTTGHNIANANTEGFTRQRVNFEQTAPFPPASRNRPEIPGQVGSGVQAGSVERVRESFLDVQFRGENTKTGYWTTKADALQKMEVIMNEPSEQGLSKTMDRFWQSLQDLSVNPEDAGARSVVRQRGIALAETFNYLNGSIKGIQQDINSQINVTTKEINSLATQINNINQQIGEVEPNGYLPNDLYDERDRLVDQLSEIVEVKVTPVKSGGSALAIADGKYTVEILGQNGQPLPGVEPLVNGDTNTVSTVSVNNDGAKGSIKTVTIGGATVDAASFNSQGKMKALIEAYGYENNNGGVTGMYPDMLTKLDNMASTFAGEFNDVHKDGTSLYEMEEENGQEDIPFFVDQTGDTFVKEGFASRIRVSDDILGDVNKIAAANSNAVGDGGNALNLADVGSTDLAYENPDSLTDLNSYYEGVIGEMGVQSQEAQRLQGNSETLRQSVDEKRQSVSAVSLDEEMTNMIKFQHAYNAAARNMTMVDEMLDRIINNMGRVGR